MKRGVVWGLVKRRWPLVHRSVTVRHGGCEHLLCLFFVGKHDAFRCEINQTQQNAISTRFQEFGKFLRAALLCFSSFSKSCMFC